MPLRSNEPIFSSIPSSTNLEQLKKALEEEQKAAYPVNIRSLIAAQQVGCIIGKKGVTIQHIQNYYGVNITFIGDKKATPSYRLLHIAGSSPRCTEALKYCLKRITEDDMRQERIVENKIGLDLVLPNVFIEFLQSTDEFIKIARESNTEITVKPQFLPRSTERAVRVTIPDIKEIQRFHWAVELLAKQLLAHRGLALSAGNLFYEPLQEDSEALYNICNIPNQHDQIYY